MYVILPPRDNRTQILFVIKRWNAFYFFDYSSVLIVDGTSLYKILKLHDATIASSI